MKLKMGHDIVFPLIPTHTKHKFNDHEGFDINHKYVPRHPFYTSPFQE